MYRVARLPETASWRWPIQISTSLLFVALATASMHAQEQSVPTQVEGTVISSKEAADPFPDRIGRDDVLSVSVYDAPELSRTVRVETDGDIRLPMLKQRISAAGLGPAELEKAISAALASEEVLVDPVVTVSVAENRSRRIMVVGAVRSQISIQPVGRMTLLDAISQAGGISENAGPDILLSRQSVDGEGESVTLTQRIPVRALVNTVAPALNLELHGGETVRVPEAGRVYVAGNVKKPGSYLLTEDSGITVLKAVALSDGLGSFAGHTAYIYRFEGGKGGKNEIPIELKKILQKKSPDVQLAANDILYVPDASGRRASARALEMSLGIGLGLAGLLLSLTR